MSRPTNTERAIWAVLGPSVLFLLLCACGLGGAVLLAVLGAGVPG